MQHRPPFSLPEKMCDISRECPFCAARGLFQRVTLRERYFGMGDAFGYVVCGNCRSLYIEEPAIDISRYYPKDYYSYARADRPGLLGAIDRDFSKRSAKSHVAFLQSAGASVSLESSILDVGSGSGMLLRSLQRLGFRNARGVDPYLDSDVDTGSVTVMRKTLDDLASDPLYAGKIDIIMFHHSLEHFPEPVETLRTASKLLASNGAILVRLPIVNYAWEKYGENWFGLETPRHLAIPSEPGMIEGAKRAGFIVSRTSI